MIPKPQPPFGQPPLTDPLDHLTCNKLSWGKLTRVEYGILKSTMMERFKMFVQLAFLVPGDTPYCCTFVDMFTALGEDRPAQQRT